MHSVFVFRDIPLTLTSRKTAEMEFVMSGIVIRSPVKGRANREVVLPLLAHRESPPKAELSGSQMSRRSATLEHEEIPRAGGLSQMSDKTTVHATRRVCNF